MTTVRKLSKEHDSDGSGAVQVSSIADTALRKKRFLTAMYLPVFLLLLFETYNRPGMLADLF